MTKGKNSQPFASRIVGDGEEAPDQLLANPLNWRRHPKEQHDALEGMLRTVGWVQRVIVNRTTGHVVDGHLRVELALRRGEPTVPVLYVELTAEEERVVLAAIDPIGGLAQTDQGMLDSLLEGLVTGDEQLDALLDSLRSEPEPTVGLTDPDEAPAVQAEAITNLGDVWLLGSHRVMCGDSTGIDAVEKLMSGQKADMVFTDPPYNVAVTGGTHDSRDKKNFGKGPKILNDSMPDAQFKQFLVDAFTTMGLVTKDGAAVYVAHADTEGVNFRIAFEEAGFMLKQCLIWAKQQFVFGRSDYHWQHEPILYGWRAGASHSFYGARNQGTLWNIDRPMRSEKEHPTQKPVALVEKAVLNSSKSGDLLFEPFGGGGSTLIACEKTGRHARLMELDPRYCDVIVRRWQAFTGKQATLESDGRTFDEVAAESVTEA